MSRLWVPSVRSQIARRKGAAASTSAASGVGNMEMQQARRISFPHEREIRRSLGTAFPFEAVVDRAGCAARGTPAFNEGGVAHFANERPDVHVAAHEAAHQLQNAGKSHDHGLGAEGHAGAVADRVKAGRSAKSLIGRRGRPVARAERGYVDVDSQGNWDQTINPSRVYRMSDTGQTMTKYGSKDAWAEAGLITSANATLQAQKSGIEISPGGGGPTVRAVDGSMHSLSKIEVKQKLDPGSDQMFSDCGKLAREIMGPTGDDATASVVATPGGRPSTVAPILSQSSPREALALTFLIDDKMRGIPGYPNVSDDQKKQVAQEAYREYEAMSDADKEAFLKKTIAAPPGRGQEIGMDEAAAPAVGEAYAVTRSEYAYDQHTEFPYHWAAVIMAAGGDRVTLENVGVDADKNAKWYFNTYGMAKGQTFHEQWTNFGADRHTMRMRTQDPLAAQAPQMRTYQLFEELAKGADEALIRAEVAKRQLTVDVVCKATDDSDEDEIFLTLALGGGMALNSGTVTMKAGTGHIFSFPLGGLIWPVANPLIVSVWDGEFLVDDDLIGSVSMFSPYRPKLATVSNGTASYELNLSF
jgi:hypothetical protein